MKYIIKKLGKKDLKPGGGLLRTLANLTEVRPMSYKKRLKIFKEIKRERSIIFVAISREKETKGQIIGTVKFVRDQKFTRGGALAAHLEDFAVRKNYEGNGIAKALWSQFLKRARALGCYKIVLDCDQELTPFYKKFGFYEFGICLRLKP